MAVHHQTLRWATLGALVLGLGSACLGQVSGIDAGAGGGSVGGGGGGLATGGGVATGGGAAGGGGGATGGGGAATGGGSTGGGSATGGGGAATGLFTQPHAWSKDVSTLPASPRSPAILGALQALGGWGNGNRLQVDFSIALLDATSATPRVTVTAPAGGYCYGGPDCDPVPAQVPLPPGGNIEGSAGYTCATASNDCHLLVVERSEHKLYELYQATQTATGFTALGVFVWDLTRQYPDALRGEQCTSADAAGLPIAALLPTAEEVAAGLVPHALRFILPNARMKAAVYVRPATHAGGPSSSNPDAPPYGVRLRLKPGFDETPFSPGERVLLRAMKRHGLILSDGGNIALTFADDRRSTVKWASLGVTAQSFLDLAVSDFEVVDLGPEVALTYDCVRTP